MQVQPNPPPAEKREKISVLIVDDEPDILRVIKKVLEEDGYQVYGFTHPVAALEHFKQEPKQYSVLISDIKMPKMTGFQLARSVRELNSEIKILLMTAFEVNMTEFAKVLPSTNIDGLVRKPFKISHFKEVLENTIYEPISLG